MRRQGCFFAPQESRKQAQEDLERARARAKEKALRERALVRARRRPHFSRQAPLSAKQKKNLVDLHSFDLHGATRPLPTLRLRSFTRPESRKAVQTRTTVVPVVKTAPIMYTVCCNAIPCSKASLRLDSALIKVIPRATSPPKYYHEDRRRYSRFWHPSLGFALLTSRT